MGPFGTKQEPRDTYGPMDIDGDESMNRLEHLMLSQEDLDGPARKREFPCTPLTMFICVCL